jgi:zinc transporter 1/2/3
MDSDKNQLYTHASLMFANECLGRLSYEATTSAIVMAGIFLAFLVEYVSHRIVLLRAQRSDGTAASQTAGRETSSPDKTAPQQTLATFADHHLPSSGLSQNTYLSVLVMEAGIIFHSILIGLTLVVAGDSYYITLFIVIVFHQFFEGVALGSRIALLSGSRHPMLHKLLMATAFALITPLGMAIGLGVLNHFNGNDPSTIVAIGTLDALSAGILLWVGVVDMWARDWVIVGGELVDARLGKVLYAGLSLVSGMVLMGVLGKWA